MRLLTHKGLKKEKGIDYSPYHLRRLEYAGKFPKRVPLGGRVAWLEEEVDQWLIEKINARDGK